MRYAIYFTPPAEDPLVHAASSWLGRDAFGRDVEEAAPQYGLIREPARYGFHGTLKAPFHLAAARSESELFDAFDEFAARTSPFEIGKMAIEQIGPFFALVPDTGHETQITKLAEDVVRSFEPFRAPLGHADIERRNPKALPERQRRYLLDWGYPYLFEEFRFHMTLTGKVAPEETASTYERLKSRFGSFDGKPMKISHLALFFEPERGAPFNVIRMRAL